MDIMAMFESTLKAAQAQQQQANVFESVKVVENPRAIIVNGLFGKKLNEQIFAEAVGLHTAFGDAVIGDGEVKKELRSNTVSYYDGIYTGRRQQSALLQALDDLFKSNIFQQIVGSAGEPFCDFAGTNTHETQVSRYGNAEQKYDWHVDRFGANIVRHITLVYYFFKEPKQFNGGNLLLSNGVIYEGKIINKEATIHEIVPENDMCVIFASTTPHCVAPCTSPPAFEDGRFSANCWIGFKAQ